MENTVPLYMNSTGSRSWSSRRSSCSRSFSHKARSFQIRHEHRPWHGGHDDKHTYTRLSGKWIHSYNISVFTRPHILSPVLNSIYCAGNDQRTLIQHRNDHDDTAYRPYILSYDLKKTSGASEGRSGQNVMMISTPFFQVFFIKTLSFPVRYVKS